MNGQMMAQRLMQGSFTGTDGGAGARAQGSTPMYVPPPPADIHTMFGLTIPGSFRRDAAPAPVPSPAPAALAGGVRAPIGGPQFMGGFSPVFHPLAVPPAAPAPAQFDAAQDYARGG